jgi:hypothetical protein
VIFIDWIFYGLGAAAIFPLRRASRGRALPYRVACYPWTALVPDAELRSCRRCSHDGNDDAEGLMVYGHSRTKEGI